MAMPPTSSYTQHEQRQHQHEQRHQPDLVNDNLKVLSAAAGHDHRPFFDPRMALYDAKGHNDPVDNMYNHLDYGSADPVKFSNGQASGYGARWKVNFFALFLAVAVPFIFFVGTFQTMSFELYDHHPGLALLVIGTFFFCTLVIGAFAVQAARDEMTSGRGTWLLFILFTGLFACCAGTGLGYANREWNSKWYYQYINLRRITNVDPGSFQGQQVLDAGEIDFMAGTRVDSQLHSFWQHKHSYCVAPIISGDAFTSKMASYDLWAVGKDCCGPQPDSFSCGNGISNKDMATGGLRVIDPDDVQHYRLAVEQAAAKHNIQFHHPIFLHMETKPYVTIKSYIDDARMFGYVTTIAYLIMQCVLVGVQATAFGVGKPSGFKDAASEDVEHRAALSFINPHFHQGH